MSWYTNQGTLSTSQLSGFFSKLEFWTHSNQSPNLAVPLTLGKRLNLYRPQFNSLMKENDDCDNNWWNLRNDDVMYMFYLK